MSGPPDSADDRRRRSETARFRSRRRALGIVGTGVVTAIAGCTAEAGQRVARRPLVDATAEVEPNQYEPFEFGLESETWITVSAHLSDRSAKRKTDGPGVDVVVMSSEQYDRFRTDRTFEYVGEVSMPDVVTGQVSNTLDPGEYVALVDNTAAGPAAPGDSSVTAFVDLEIASSKSRP